ncbi:unnamed protein product [Moneuplotes crassus]|uniref:Uncharacterized protein n=1 Tax=Euplotes crassus TaxID=5936 RepID=A0AAD1Y473_EUPCR|nr:unnamed protein product [Moneuplotes crassus]
MYAQISVLPLIYDTFQSFSLISAERDTSSAKTVSKGLFLYLFSPKTAHKFIANLQPQDLNSRESSYGALSYNGYLLSNKIDASAEQVREETRKNHEIIEIMKANQLEENKFRIWKSTNIHKAIRELKKSDNQIKLYRSAQKQKKKDLKLLEMKKSKATLLIIFRLH